MGVGGTEREYGEGVRQVRSKTKWKESKRTKGLQIKLVFTMRDSMAFTLHTTGEQSLSNATAEMKTSKQSLHSL